MNINLVPANGVARGQKLCDKDEMRQGLKPSVDLIGLIGMTEVMP